MMAPLIVIIGIMYARFAETRLTGKAAEAGKVTLGKLVPWFVLGFLGMTIIRSVGVALGVLPADTANPPAGMEAATAILKLLDEVARFCIIMALAAVGLGTRFSDMRKTGLKPFVVGLCVAAVLALFSLSVIAVTGLGAGL